MSSPLSVRASRSVRSTHRPLAMGPGPCPLTPSEVQGAGSGASPCGFPCCCDVTRGSWRRPGRCWGSFLGAQITGPTTQGGARGPSVPGTGKPLRDKGPAGQVSSAFPLSPTHRTDEATPARGVGDAPSSGQGHLVSSRAPSPHPPPCGPHQEGEAPALAHPVCGARECAAQWALSQTVCPP